MGLPIAPIAHDDNAANCTVCGRKLVKLVFVAGQEPSAGRPPNAPNPWLGRAVCSACKPTRDWSGHKARWRSFMCQKCGRKVHYLIGREYRYCTYHCAQAAWIQRATERRSRHRAENRTKQLVCEACGIAFTAARSDARYCSATCRQRAHRKAASFATAPA
jgi:hypothetical protein